MGGNGSVVEVDGTFIGRKEGAPKRRGTGHKQAVLSLVERGGEVRSVHVEDLPIVNANVAKEARVMTDDASQYEDKLGGFAQHGVRILESADAAPVRDDLSLIIDRAPAVEIRANSSRKRHRPFDYWHGLSVALYQCIGVIGFFPIRRDRMPGFVQV
jgi:hypothetical protein